NGDGTVAPGWTPGGGVIVNSQNGQGSFILVSDGQSGAFVSWPDARSAPTSSPANTNPVYLDLYAQHFDAFGQVVAGWQTNGTPLCLAPDAQYAMSGASDGAGGAIFGWHD